MRVAGIRLMRFRSGAPPGAPEWFSFVTNPGAYAPWLLECRRSAAPNQAATHAAAESSPGRLLRRRHLTDPIRVSKAAP
jgi:hypothetical protein